MIKRIVYSALLFVSANCFSQTDTTAAVDNQSDTTSTEFKVPIFSTSGADAESDMDQQDVSSLLQSSRDVFTQFASFQFGVARYRMRGYSAENQNVMINGINVNNLELGFSSWSNWGGLNDVTRYTETRFGNGANRYSYSGPGGYTNIDSKASSFKKGTRISYASANRIFRNRFMLTHSTGMMYNGWAFTFSASNRSGNQVYVPGTYFNASSFYISADKRIDDKNLLSFTGFMAPAEQGRSSAETLEAYQLAKDHYYNSLWGFQNKKVRNSSVSTSKRPMLMLSHVFKVNTSSHLTSSVFYNFGTSGLTSLNWYNASNPRPDYYRYLPSYYYDKGDQASGDYLSNKWATDPNWRQINWDRLIQLNQNNLYVLPSQLGQGVNTTDTRARYIIENKVEDLKNAGINTVYNSRIDKVFLSIGFNANMYRNRKYKVMEDLLGATYWLDYDQFAQNLGVDPQIQQNDISKPDRKVFKGDRFGYDYSINVDRVELWSQAEYTFEKVDVYGGFSVSDCKVWREGFIANGKFPLTSKGSSKKLDFVNYGVKTGFTYKITGRHFITSNFNYMTRTPEANNMFFSPRVRNDVVSGITPEKITSFDANYEAKFPDFKLRVTYYCTQINDQLWLRTYWNDTYNNNVNLIMQNVDETHQGIELGVQKTLFTSHVLQGALGYGQFIYTNRPTLSAWQDNNSKSLFTNRKTYLQNYRLGGSPQLVAGLGYRFNAKKQWSAGISFNYFDEIYVEPNPDRRTSEAIAKYLSNESAQYNEIIAQEKLPSYFVVNINGNKSLRIMKKYFLNVSLSVNNLLNNKNSLSYGYEQLRWDYANIKKFDNKYYYMQGATYMATVNFNF